MRLGGTILLRLLLLLLLCISHHLVSLEANQVPTTRSPQNNFHYGFRFSQEMNTKRFERLRRKMMEVEVNDYPGSGANNRHSPRPQLGRGCTTDNC